MSACTCTNHLGHPKSLYRSRPLALEYAMRRTKWTGLARIYRCPAGAGWHVTTQPFRSAA